jgi:light-regulated signal transduction histidine kinase (bacteriophytochrome)
MVDELLELSRTSRRELSKQLTGLRSLVSEVLEELKPEVEDREIEWRIGELPFADCDPTLTRQVFVNLLANAVKFTRDRKPAVIEVGQDLSGGQTVLFVRDNGVGFSMKYVEKLFGVFQRLHRREDFEGTGVGLVTVQRIIHKHGGRIWAQAELEKGATFYFTLEPPDPPRLEQPNVEPKFVFAGER